MCKLSKYFYATICYFLTSVSEEVPQYFGSKVDSVPTFDFPNKNKKTMD